MSKNMQINEKWKELNSKILLNIGSSSCTNITRRKLHAELELFRLDIDEKVSEISKDDFDAINAQCDEVLKKMNLKPIRNDNWWYWIDICFRFIGVVSGIITLGLILPIPIVIFRVIDKFLIYIGIISPFSMSSEFIKRFLSKALLILSGITVETQGLNNSYFKESTVMLTFSHSSNLDGFLVSGTCPIQHFALAKKELFIVPFFSWLAFAIGGVPVDRNNRERAINALKRTAENAKDGKACLVVAPEGTRSTTGQLLPFKKGKIFFF